MLLTILMGTVLFGFGYYLGDQVGRTAHIREHLRQVRAGRRAADNRTL